MSIRKTFAVLGLGRYGTAVAKEFADSGAEVLAVDMDENVVNHAAMQIPFCKCANITDPEVFAQLGIGDMDEVIIAMADSLESTVMAITLCKEKGVYYLNVAEAFKDELGNLPTEASPKDGMHFGSTYYMKWFDYLKCHAVTTEN